MKLLFSLLLLISLGVYAEPPQDAPDADAQTQKALRSAIKLSEELILEQGADIGESQKIKGPDIDIYDVTGHLADIVFLLSKGPFIKKIQSLIGKLSYPGDPTNYQIQLSISPAPWAGLQKTFSMGKFKAAQPNSTAASTSAWTQSYQGAALEISVGLFAFAENEAELAAIIAYHMSLNNPESHQFFENKKNTEWIDTMLRGLGDFDEETYSKGVLKSQIRADLAAVDRLIKSGYNPWAIFNIQKRLSEWIRTTRINDARTTVGFLRYLGHKLWGKKFLELVKQPLPELRMNAIKQYIAYRQTQTDLSVLEEQKDPYPENLKLVHLRARLLSAPATKGYGVKFLTLTVAVGGVLSLLHLTGASEKITGLEPILNETFRYLGIVGSKISSSVSDYYKYALWAAGIYGASFITKKIYNNFYSIRNYAKTKAYSIAQTVSSAAKFSFKSVKSFAHNIQGYALIAGKISKQVGLETAKGIKNVLAATPRFIFDIFKTVGSGLIKSVKWIVKSLARIIEFLFKMVSNIGKALLNIIHRFKVIQNTNAKTIVDDLPILSDALVNHFSMTYSGFSNSFVPQSFSIWRILKIFKKLDHIFSESNEETRKRVWSALAPIFYDGYHVLVRNPVIRESFLKLWSKYGEALPRDYIFSEQFKDALYKVSYVRIFYTGGLRLYGTVTASPNDPPDLLSLGHLKYSKSGHWHSNFYGSDILENWTHLKYVILWVSLAEKYKSLPSWQKKYFLENISTSEGFTGDYFSFNRKMAKIFFTPQVLGELLDSAVSKYNPALSAYRETKISIEQKIKDSAFETDFTKVINLFEDYYHYLGPIYEYLRTSEGSKVPVKPLNLYSYLQGGDAKISWDNFFSKSVQSIQNDWSQFAISTFSRKISSEKPSFGKNKRAKWEAQISNWFDAYLDKNISSIVELQSLIEEKLTKYNFNLNVLTHDLYRAIFRHPEWIRSKEDIEALTSVNYFWPKTGIFKKKETKIEKVLLSSLRVQAEKFPRFWSVEPSAAEALHLRIIEFSKRNKIYRETWNDQFEFWKALSSRGVTGVTDDLFKNLLEKADSEQVLMLEDEGLEGRIWDQPLKIELLRKEINRSEYFKALVETANASLSPGLEEARLLNLARLLGEIQSKIPERGIGFVKILEDISNRIISHPKEAELIQKAKFENISPSAAAQDFSIRSLSEVMDTVLEWKHRIQWDFVLFLRGDIEATPFIQEQFSNVGPERVRRIFQVLPLDARAGVIESFLSSTRGLLPTVDPKKGFSRVVIDRILHGNSDQAQEVGRQVLEAFLYSMKGGKENLRSYVLSYLLSMLKSNEEASIGTVLKTIFEVFGATGVKIGQILAATEILDPKDTEQLYGLQERAKVPDRATIYSDLRELTKRPEFPMRILDLKGAASLKYALHTRDEQNGDEFILKILRAESPIHTNGEFKQLERMAEYLVKNYGSKYGLLRAIIRAAKKAVERELQLDREVAMSQAAAQEIYTQKRVGEIDIKVPGETLMVPRLMASELAPGGSVKDLDPEGRSQIGETIWKIEGDNLFRPNNGKDILFDPDRHAGNYRVHMFPGGRAGAKGQLSPIDFGQVVKMTEKERSQIFDLFALAQILKETGPTRWATKRVMRVLEISEKSLGVIHESIVRYFTKTKDNPSEVAAYYNLLAALEEAQVGRDIVFFDFIRGIIQLTQYKKFIKNYSAVIDPRERLKAEVSLRANQMLLEMKSEISETDGLKGHIIQGAIAPEKSKFNRGLAKCYEAIRNLRGKS